MKHEAVRELEVKMHAALDDALAKIKSEAVAEVDEKLVGPLRREVMGK